MESMVVDPEFWRGRRVFLTGHTGFKGGWLAYWLQGMGAEVTGYALEPPTEPSLFAAAAIENGLRKHVVADLRDAARLKEELLAAKPQIVFHLAAQPLVRRSYEAPEETFSVNVMGTLYLFEAVREAEQVEAVVNVTTDKCYENREWVWGYREDEPLGGHDPYSASKACAELLTSCYRRSFLAGRPRLASARAGNVIGGGDWGIDRLVPDLMRGFASGEAPVIRNPHAIRPWQHVLDAVAGYLCLAQRLAGPNGGQFEGAWNFGPNHAGERSVGELARQLEALWGGDARCVMAAVPQGPHEAGVLKLDSTKARAKLGWAPRWGLDRALQATVEWYRAHARGAGDLASLMDAQIARHQGHALTGQPQAGLMAS